jgi:hypothetical protein
LRPLGAPVEKRSIKKERPGEALPECTVRGLGGFLDFCLVDLRLKRKTAVNHRRLISLTERGKKVARKLEEIEQLL